MASENPYLGHWINAMFIRYVEYQPNLDHLFKGLNMD